MRITVLVENTEGMPGCGTEHGLSLYIETKEHRLLFDTGASGLMLENAAKLGVDPGLVEMVILSHGHYDHGGGILPFAERYPGIPVWVQETVFGEYLSESGPEGLHDIGLDPRIRELEQLRTAEDFCTVAEGLTLFSGIGLGHPLPPADAALKERTEKGVTADIFRHEQCLVVREGGRSVLFSGCAHHGMPNILDRYRELFGDEPDAVVSGLHTRKKSGYTDEDLRYIAETAEELKKTRSVYYTGHCTGEIPYEIMRKILGGQIRYLHTGDTLMP